MPPLFTHSGGQCRLRSVSGATAPGARRSQHRTSHIIVAFSPSAQPHRLCTSVARCSRCRVRDQTAAGEPAQYTLFADLGEGVGTYAMYHIKTARLYDDVFCRYAAGLFFYVIALCAVTPDTERKRVCKKTYMRGHPRRPLLSPRRGTATHLITRGTVRRSW